MEENLIMEKREIKRGDIYHADLNPIVGSEQGGYRPVLVIQNNRGNKHSPTVIVAAITSRPKHKMPTHVPLNAALDGPRPTAETQSLSLSWCISYLS